MTDILYQYKINIYNIYNIYGNSFKLHNMASYIRKI